MTAPPESEEEPGRLARLKQLAVLDTQAEAVLDEITAVAAAACGAPISLISLVDECRQWWKSAVGLPQGSGTARELSFCTHAITGDVLFEVEDATRDPRFCDNPIVTGEPKVIHYAGMPLVMPGGEHIGTICVIDHVPRRLDERNRTLLARLARLVVGVLLLRESDLANRRRIAAEQALAVSEAKFRTISNAMPQMVWSALPDGRHDYFNERWYDFTGLSAGTEQSAGLQGLIHPDDRQEARRAWHASLASGAGYEREYRMRHGDGSYRWVLDRALPVRGEDALILRWMGTLTDIHEQRGVQEELRAVNQRKDDFLAMLAHELRNPLAPISTAAEILQVSPGDTRTVLEASALITRQVRQMSSLVDDLLDVSRVTRGIVELRKDPVDLKTVLAHALEQAQPLLQARRHASQVRLCATPVFVSGDAVRLVQVISNLLNNAAKYTPEGGLISLDLDTRPGQARVVVTDNGAGIAPELLPHVFELFTQAQRARDRAQGGLGLGLALVRSLLALHGGSVQAASAGCGEGSVFTVSLPLAAPGPPAPLEALPALRRPGQPLSVMVVDDNLDAAHSLGLLLGTLGHRVRVMSDSLQALAAGRAEPAEVYVLDIGLPGMDGYQLARELRAAGTPPGPTLIALTGYGQPSDRAQSRAAGFDHHLVKPVDIARLTQILAQRP